MFLKRLVKKNLNETKEKEIKPPETFKNQEIHKNKTNIQQIQENPFLLKERVEWQNDFNLVLEAVQRKPFLLRYASKELQNNEKIVTTSISQNGLCLNYASKEFKDNEEMVFKAMKSDIYAFQFASDRIKNDRRLAFKAVIVNQDLLNHVSNALRKDEDFNRRILINAPKLYKFIDDDMKRNRTVVKKALSVQNFKNLPSGFKIDKEIAMDLLSRDANFYPLIPDELKNDFDISLQIVRRDGCCFTIIPKDHQIFETYFVALRTFFFLPHAISITKVMDINDRNEALRAVSISGVSFEHFPENLRNDLEIADVAIDDFPFALKYLGNKISGSKELAMKALSKNLEVFDFLPSNLKKDNDVQWVFKRYFTRIRFVKTEDIHFLFRD
jgi:hypothetical protein